MTTKTGHKKKEQLRTYSKKRLFIGVYGKTLGSIKATCEKAEVGRRTYYDWMDNDPEFRAEIKKAFEDVLDDVEELLNISMLRGDGASIRFFLDRRHPAYMSKIGIRETKRKRSINATSRHHS